jgi:DNA-binding XRE family transcriptional regulator
MKREDLKQARLTSVLSQGEFATKMGINVEHVRSLEYGRVNPSPKLMFKICNFYRSSPEILFPDIVNGILNTTIV